MQDIQLKINDLWQIEPASIEDLLLLQQQCKKNIIYNCTFKRKRKMKSLAKYWLLMRALEFHKGNTSDGWHLYFKAKFLPMVEFNLPSGKKILFPSSIAFDKMDENEFRDYFFKVTEYLNDNNLNIDELIQTAFINT
jgi:hypothetical protein